MIFRKNLLSIAWFALAIALAGSPNTANAGTCFVWRLTNAKTPFYLVGTIHALSSHDYPLPTGYNTALHETQRLIFEIKPDMKSDFGRMLAKASLYPKGDGVHRHVHAKTWDIIKTNFASQNMLKEWWLGDQYVGGIEQFRPWALAYTFYGIPGWSDVYSSLGVDNHLWYQGKRMHKEFGGLETDAEHVEVLGGMNDIESELILIDNIVNRQKQKGWEKADRDAWKRGDTAGLWANMQHFRKLNPGADVRLLDQRNVKWVPKIRAEINSGKPTAIVVGAGHMVGPNGLIALLERGGYKFEQL